MLRYNERDRDCEQQRVPANPRLNLYRSGSDLLGFVECRHNRIGRPSSLACRVVARRDECGKLNNVRLRKSFGATVSALA
jgi:hypothetical protein